MAAYNNSEFGKRIGALGVGQSVLATRSSRPTRVRALLYALLGVAFVLGAVFLFAQQRERPLADALPESVPLYASVNLGAGGEWYSRLQFFRGDAPRNVVFERSLNRFDLLRWERVSFGEFAGVFSGQLEFAELESGEIVLSATLADKEQWHAWAGAADITEGEIVRGFAPLGGLWLKFGLSAEDWVWYIRDNRLFIASSPSVEAELGRDYAVTAGHVLSSAGMGAHSAVLYVGDPKKTALAQDPVFRMLLQNSEHPRMLDIAAFPEKITFSTAGGAQKSPEPDLSSAPLSGLRGLYNRSEGYSAIYAPSAGSSYGAWVSALSGVMPGAMERAEELLGTFYNTDMQSLADALSDSEVVFVQSSPAGEEQAGGAWLAAATSAPKEDIRAVAETLFAITHPESTEIKLADGTSMVELRADIDGLVWEPLFVTISGEEREFSALRGAGETQGMFMGEAPGIGMVLTSDVSLINELLSLAESDANPDPAALNRSVCALGGYIGAAMRLERPLLVRAGPGLRDIERISVAEAPEGGIFGCAELRAE